MAEGWLDLARYADSAGYADDPPRTIWPYRDWVINAFDKNMSFDKFTIAQLAGDLLPDATSDNKITAFHYTVVVNNEGGTIDEEFRSVAVVDRVNTTLSTWMVRQSHVPNVMTTNMIPCSRNFLVSMQFSIRLMRSKDESRLSIPWEPIDAKQALRKRVSRHSGGTRDEEGHSKKQVQPQGEHQVATTTEARGHLTKKNCRCEQ